MRTVSVPEGMAACLPLVRSMNSTSLAVLATVLSCVALGACGGKDANPAAPSSPSTPAPAGTMTLVFTGAWPAARVDSPTVTGNGNAVGVTWPGPTFKDTDGKDAGAIWVAIKATGADVGQLRGDLRWDPSLLKLDAYIPGEWFAQGGALVDWTLLTHTLGQVSFQLARPTTMPGATGTGSVVYLRLRAIARGTSALQWSSPELRGSDSSDRPLTGGSFAGSITIQ